MSEPVCKPKMLDLNSQTPSGLPLTVGVEGDQLVIRIGVDTLAFAFEIGEDNQPYDESAKDFRRSWKVIDKHRFAKGVGIGLCDEGEDGSTSLSRVFDSAFTRAVEDDMGIDEDGRLVTHNMLHPDTAKAASKATPTRIDPVEEARAMFGDDKVVTIEACDRR